MPWNPNRLEQREGRIDRYGQKAPVVRTCLLYGSDNKIDLAVLEVLIRKAVAIRKTLGVLVPLPIDGGVQTAIFKSLFEYSDGDKQLSLDLFKDQSPEISEVHRRWDSAINREKQSMTKFAQAGIKPEEIEKELQETDRVLGNAADVERFFRTACERLGHGMKREKQWWIVSSLPDCLKNVIKEKTLIAFHEPVAEGVEYIGRNHPIVERLASFLLEESLTNQQNPTAARCGYIITKDVAQRTNLLLLRLRYLIGNLDGAATAPLMAEECIVAGFLRPNVAGLVPLTPKAKQKN